MAIVTDEEKIKKLKELQKSNAPSGSTGVVTDPDLLNKLKQTQADKVKDTPIKEPSEDTPSAVESGSVVKDFLLTLGSGILSEPMAGVAGIASSIGNLSWEKGAETVESVREAMAYQPETEEGKKGLQTVGELLAPVGEALEGASSGLGDTVYEWTGSPGLAVTAYSIPTAALELAGIKGVGKVRRLGDADLIKAQKAALVDPELRNSGFVAKVKLNKQGKLVEDKIGTKLVDNGMRENDVAIITNATPSTKKYMKDMVDIFERGKGNDVIAMNSRTTKPIGKAISTRLQTLATRRKDMGKRLNEIVDGPVGDTPVDIGNSLSGVMEVLRDEGVKPIYNAKGGLTLPDDWAKGTAFELKGLSGAKSAIEDAFKLMDSKTSAGKTTLRQAHKIKKNLDDMIDEAKLTESGVAPNTVRKIASMRKSVNDTLSTVDTYGIVNRRLSDVIDTMQPFTKYLEPGQTWDNAKVRSVVGQVTDSIALDSASSVGLVEDLQKLERYMKDANIQFKDNPAALVRFRQALLENFNVDPTVGGTESIATAAGSLGASASIGNTFGAAHDTVKLIRAGVSKRQAKKVVKNNLENFSLIKKAIEQ